MTRRSRRELLLDALVMALLIGTIAVVHGRRVVSNFPLLHWEDPLFLGHVRRHVHGLWDVARVGSYWTGLYRPLSTNLVYYVDVVAFDGDPRFLHVLAASLFTANAFLLYRLGSRLAGRATGVLAALLWCTRKESIEVPLFGSQIQSTLSMMFVLLALLVAARGARLRSSDSLLLGALGFAALASKETTFVLPVAVVLLRVARFGPDQLRLRRLFGTLFPFVVATALLFALARSRLDIASHVHYDLAPTSLASGAVLHTLGFSNTVLGTPALIRPCANYFLYPVLRELAVDPVFQGAMVVLALVSVVGLLRRTLPIRLRVSAFGVLAFLVLIAPTLPLVLQPQLYYGYPGHAGLSLACASMVVFLVRRALLRAS